MLSSRQRSLLGTRGGRLFSSLIVRVIDSAGLTEFSVDSVMRMVCV